MDPANGADFILITPEEFAPSLFPLCQLRKNQGHRIKCVTVEDIYNEFNYGIFHPSAIKTFLQHAYDNWTPPSPGYVLLVGDANTDYRDKFVTGKETKVPVHLYQSELGITPNDNWFVCVDGSDALPDMFLGRISASSAARAGEMADKVIGFERSTSYDPGGVLLTADDETDFENLCEDLIPYLPPAFYTDKVYLSFFPNVNDATQAIISSIDGGVMITNYVGHGSTTNWAGEMMFVSSDVASLNNGDCLTFVLALTCLNGYFSLPDIYCLGEEFMVAPDKGAIGCLAPSGLGYLWEHELLDKEIFSILFDQGERIMGYVTTQGRIIAYSKGATLDLVQVFTLFGDPATILKDWN